MTPHEPQVPDPTFVDRTPSDTPTIASFGPPPTLATPGLPRADLTPTQATPGVGPGALPISRSLGPPPSGLAGYEVLEEIAHGGMGIVYRARQIGLDRVVALKVMIAGEHASPELLERFQREARAAAKLQHPNIVQIYDVGRDGSKHFFTMRHVDGPSLADRIRKKEVTPRRAVEIARKVALALDYAHAHGVIHRDVKPANILVDSQGEPHLADFGLAKDLACEGVTVPGASLGTPNYAPPEQAAGDTERVDARSDVYALGASLYEALTGRPPFSGDSIFAVLKDVLSTDPIPPRKVNPKIQRDIETICLKAMEKSQERRYQTAKEMADDIGRYLEGEPILARPVSWAERHWRRALKNRAVVAPTAIAVLVVIAFGGWVGLDALQTSRRVRKELAAAAQSEREADAAPSRDDRRALYTKARDVLVGAIGLDKENREANEAFHRVTARLDAITREEQEEQRAAQEKADSAQAALGKSQLVSKAFARWSRVSGALTQLEAIAYDDRLSEEEKATQATAAWPPIAKFLGETPDDPASRGAGLALVGWAMRYRGDSKDAVMTMKEAAKIDPDLPYGRLMEALDIFSQLVEIQPLPSMVIGPTGIQVGESHGVPENMDVAVKHLGKLLTEARAARVWGKEGAEDFASCMEGILAMQAGEWARADECFTRALTAPDLAAFESGLLLGRSEVRYMAERLQDSIADLDALAKARPGWSTIPFREAQALYALALEGGCKGEDPRPRLKESIARFNDAVALKDENLEAYANRAVAWQLLGEADLARGVDPLPSYRKAIEDFAEVLRRDPDHVNSYVNLGNLGILTGQVQASHGEDPTAAFDRAVAAFDEAIKRRPDMAEIYNNRGNARCSKASWEEGRGADARDGVRRAIQDYDEALRRQPEMASAFNNRGTAWNDLGEAEASRGIDPTTSYEKGIVDFGRAASIEPKYVEAWVNLGQTRTNLGDWLLQIQKDPSVHLARAIEDLERALSINAAFVGAYSIRGFAGKLLGQWEASQGKDPCATWDAAVKILDEGTRRNPGLANAYNHRGLIWLSRAEWEAGQGLDPRPSLKKAIADNGRLLELNPESLPALCNRGSCWGRVAEEEKRLGLDPKGSIEKAMADYKAVLSINPRVWQAHQCLGTVFELSGEDEKALEAYQRAYGIVGDAVPTLREAIDRIKASKRPRR